MTEQSLCDSANSLHTKILECVIVDLEKLLYSSHSTVKPVSPKHLLKKVFRNYRYSSIHKHQGLRLTTLGNQLLRKHFVAYDFTIDHSISNRSLLALDQNMNWPYYVGKTKVTFYSENDAAWFSLNGNNLEDFVDYI